MPHTIPATFASLYEKYPQIYVILSPPRCSSTAFARVFWEHPTIRYYSHEPFEVTYYQNADLAAVLAKLHAPLDLAAVKHDVASQPGRALVIKEMPYQVGQRLPLLLALATGPAIFLIRDPRLNIASRMAKKQQVGHSPLFPLIETGWELLAGQIEYCRQQAIPHLIVDSTEFRNHPADIFGQVLARFGLPFSNEMLRWQPCSQVELDNLAGQHRHLYARVLGSTGLQPATEPLPALDDFPTANGFRAHVARCLKLYQALSGLPQRVRVQAPLSTAPKPQ